MCTVYAALSVRPEFDKIFELLLGLMSPEGADQAGEEALRKGIGLGGPGHGAAPVSVILDESVLEDELRGDVVDDAAPCISEYVSRHPVPAPLAIARNERIESYLHLSTADHSPHLMDTLPAVEPKRNVLEMGVGGVAGSRRARVVIPGEV